MLVFLYIFLSRELTAFTDLKQKQLPKLETSFLEQMC